MFRHGDKVEFELYPGKWITGTIYGTFDNGDVIVQSDETPPQLHERSENQGVCFCLPLGLPPIFSLIIWFDIFPASTSRSGVNMIPTSAPVAYSIPGPNAKDPSRKPPARANDAFW